MPTAASTSSAAAIAITARDVRSEDHARRAAPFMVPSPIAICPATSTDALSWEAIAWNATLITLITATPAQVVPARPRGTVPFLSLRPVDWWDKRFHRLWITLLSTRETINVGRVRRGPQKNAGPSGALVIGTTAAQALSHVLRHALAPVRVAPIKRGCDRDHPHRPQGIPGGPRPSARTRLASNSPRRLARRCAAATASPPAPAPDTTSRRGRPNGIGPLIAGAHAGAPVLHISGPTHGDVGRTRLPYAAWKKAGAALRHAPARRTPLVQANRAPTQALVRSPS
jgi:hypothetical protein